MIVNSELINFIFHICMLALFTIVTSIARKLFLSHEIQTKMESTEKSIDKILGKFFQDEKVEEKKTRFREMELIKRKMEQEIEFKSSQMTKKAAKILKSSKGEKNVIEQGGNVYTSFSFGFNAASPRNEKERNKDMQDLLDAVKVLEGFDQEQYFKERDKTDDIAKGLFYDRITSRLYKAMRKEKLHKEPLLIFDKLIYLGLKNIKKIRRKDLINSLRYLKDADYIKNYIEINPQLILISQTDDKIRFTNAEKVILVFAHEKDVLTLSRLMKSSKWKTPYAKKIRNGLVKKGYAEFADNVIKIKGFETRQEKKLRITLEKEIESLYTKKEAAKQEKSRQLEEEYQKQQDSLYKKQKEEQSLEDELKEVTNQKKAKEEAKTKIKMAEEAAKADTLKKFKLPTVKSLPKAKKISAKKSATIKLIKPKVKKLPKRSQEVDLTTDELVGIDEKMKAKVTKHQELEHEVKNEMGSKGPEVFDDFDGLDDLNALEDVIGKLGAMEESTVKKVASTGDSDIDDLNFDDIDLSNYVGDDPDEEISEEAIIDGILSIFENYEHITGGLMDINRIHFLLTELYPDITLGDVISAKGGLKNMGLLQDEIDIDNIKIWLFKFKSDKITEDMKELIKIIKKNGWQTKEDLGKLIGWDEEKVLNTMKQLQDLETLRLDENKRIVIPGLFINN